MYSGPASVVVTQKEKANVAKWLAGERYPTQERQTVKPSQRQGHEKRRGHSPR